MNKKNEELLNIALTAINNIDDIEAIEKVSTESINKYKNIFHQYEKALIGNVLRKSILF